ncbi:MAG: alpha/beta hydrolase [Hydrogenophilus sp.]|nr:alpha/beta hydrolase [Hydrogenophilus sp.]
MASLELLHEPPTVSPRPLPPLLFLHGAFGSARCWHHWLRYFAQRGYDAWALSLPGHGGTSARKPLDLLSLDDYLAHLLSILPRLPAPPILLGHSMGGFLVQRAIARTPFPAAILLASVPPTGLAFSLWQLFLNHIQALWAIQRYQIRGALDLDPLARLLFHHPPSPDLLAQAIDCAQPESTRALLDLILTPLFTPPPPPAFPVLVFGAEHDHLIPWSETERTARHYRVSPRKLPDAGHAFMFEPHWPRLADTILEALPPAPSR